MTDTERVQHYLQTRRAEDLDAVVRRHVDWVYSCARRQLRGDEHLAADVTQAVFLALMQKPPRVKDDAALGAWLFGVTRYAAFRAIRSESRRRRHEQEAAHMRSETIENAGLSDESWQNVAPMLDPLLAKLSQQDQRSVILRFFQQRSYVELGEAMGITEEAARKRVSRAIEKLRTMLAAEGVTAPAAALSAGMLAHATQPAPAAVISAISHGAAASSLAGSLTGGIINMLKIKFAAAVAMLCVIPTVGLVVLAQIAIPPRVSPPVAAVAATQPQATTQPVFADALVVDDKGQPIAGADVYVVQRLFTKRLDPLSEIVSTAGPVKSDMQGFVRFTTLADIGKAASYSRTYYARVPGQKVGAARESFSPEYPPPSKPVRMTLVNSTTVNGIVLLPDGFQPRDLKVRLLGANIEGLPGRTMWSGESIDGTDEAFNRAWPKMFQTRVGPDQRFAITDLPADGAVSIAVEGPGLAQAQTRHERFDRQNFDVRMQPQAVVTGRVVRAEDASPARGIPMLLRPKSALAYTGAFTAMTNDQGEFRFEGLPEGVYNLVADTSRPREWTMQARDKIRLEIGQTLTGIEAKLESGTIVRGQVIAARGGQPVVGATIAALSPADNEGECIATGHSDEAGNFTMRLPMGPTKLYVMYAGKGYTSPEKQGSRIIQIDAKGAVDGSLTFAMPAEKQRPNAGTATIRGQVVDADGKPLAHIKIGHGEPMPFGDDGLDLGVFRTSAAITDAQGNFELTVSAGAKHELRITSPDYSGKAEDVTPQPGATVARKIVAVPRPVFGQISGTVVDPQGKPVSGVDINRSDTEEILTDDQGNFSVPIRSIDSPLRISAYKTGFETRDWQNIPLDSQGVRFVLYPTSQRVSQGVGNTALKNPQTLLGQPALPVEVDNWVKLGIGGIQPQLGQGRATLLLLAEDGPSAAENVSKLQDAATKLDAQAIAIFPIYVHERGINEWAQDAKITAFVGLDRYVPRNEYRANGATRIAYGAIRLNRVYHIDAAGNVINVQYDLPLKR